MDGPSKAELLFEAFCRARFDRTLNEAAAAAGFEVDWDWHWIRRSPEAAIVEWEGESEESRQAWEAVAGLPGKPSAEACFLAFARSWPALFGDNPQWEPESRKAEGWRAVADYMAEQADDEPGATH